MNIDTGGELPPKGLKLKPPLFSIWQNETAWFLLEVSPLTIPQPELNPMLRRWQHVGDESYPALHN